LCGSCIDRETTGIIEMRAIYANIRAAVAGFDSSWPIATASDYCRPIKILCLAITATNTMIGVVALGLELQLSVLNGKQSRLIREVSGSLLPINSKRLLHSGSQLAYEAVNH
jgi:hypothetical protein